ncbi:hypothetical protein [Bacillus cereus]|uniref:Uncharacterized protein n=1 Tax=Bacillus cereus TaxID=1396 RepID=A0A164K8V8_BACCE|nr:hypothetical protein [Bacillus cereus]KZD48698.1 hypothetical protein B4088_6626 [Bacillus cereus]
MNKEDNKLSAIIEEIKNQVQNPSQNGKVILGISTAMEILKYLEEKEEDTEDAELSARFGSRAALPDNQWITKDPNQSLKDWYEERRRERLNGK